MVASVIGTAACLGCGGVIRLRKGIVIKYCGEACGKKYRARVNGYSNKRWWLERRARKRAMVMRAIETDAELAQDVLRVLVNRHA